VKAGSAKNKKDGEDDGNNHGSLRISTSARCADQSKRPSRGARRRVDGCSSIPNVAMPGQRPADVACRLTAWTEVSTFGPHCEVELLRVDAGSLNEPIGVHYRESTVVELCDGLFPELAQNPIDMDAGETGGISDMLLCQREMDGLCRQARISSAIAQKEFQKQARNALACGPPAEARQVIEQNASISRDQPGETNSELRMFPGERLEGCWRERAHGHVGER